MIRYFPFSEKFDLKMGTSPLPADQCFIECDEEYKNEVALKRKLLQEDHSYYFQADEKTELVQWEVVEKVLTTLVLQYPAQFKLDRNHNQWHWENKILKESQTFTFGDSRTLPLQPLDWVGRQIQEDLIILNKESILIAGQLCFPSGWCLNEKMRKYFLDIHAPLPSLLNPMMQTASNFIERLPSNRTFVRNNWGFRIGNQLDLSSKHSLLYGQLLQAAYELTPNMIGDHIYLRIEHQSLSRLPISEYILFTIHTYQSLLNEEAKNKERMRVLSSFLKTIPSELLEYKLMTPFAASLMSYVDQHHL